MDIGLECEVLIGRKGSQGLTPMRLKEMYSLRSKVFNDRNQWGLPTTNGLEIDSFDSDNAVYIVCVECISDSVIACWRLLPTTSDYMLNTVFKHLAPSSTTISDPHIWELSRFAVEKRLMHYSPMLASCITRGLFFVAREFAFNEGVERFVTVMSPSLYRLLMYNGLTMPRIDKISPEERHRLGQTACYIDIDDNFDSFAGDLPWGFRLQYSV